MAKEGSMLKWAVLVGLVLIAPWVLFLIALYLAWKAGAFGRMAKAFTSVRRKAGISDTVSRWKLARSKKLDERALTYKYYTYGGGEGAAFAIVPDCAGFRCISAFSIMDSSGAIDSYKRAMGEVLKVLNGSSSRVVITLVFSGGEHVENRIQVVTRVSGLIHGEFQRAGFEAMDKIRLATGLVEAEEPTLKVRVCRGKEILAMPALGEGK